MCVCVHECVCACVRVCGVCVCACKTTRSNKQSRTNLSNHTCIRHSHAVAPGVCAVAIRKVPRLLGVTPPPLIHPFNLCVIDRRRREVLHVVVKLRQKEGTQVHTISTVRLHFSECGHCPRKALALICFNILPTNAPHQLIGMQLTHRTAACVQELHPLTCRGPARCTRA